MGSKTVKGYEDLGIMKTPTRKIPIRKFPPINLPPGKLPLRGIPTQNIPTWKIPTHVFKCSHPRFLLLLFYVY